MYNQNQKREAFLLNNFKKAMSVFAEDREVTITNYYGKPKTWVREKGPLRMLKIVPDGEGKGSRYYTVLVPQEANYLIDG